MERIKSNYHTLYVLKNAESKPRKATISNCNHDLLKCVCECCLNVLRDSVKLSGRDEQKHKAVLSKVADKSVPLATKKM